MPAAVAVPLIIGAASAGAQVYSAKKQAGAARGAAQDQQRAGDRALAANQAVYQDQRSMMAPWITAGQSSVNTLGRLLTPGPGAKFASAPLPALGPGPFAGGNTAMPRPVMAGGNPLASAMRRGPAPSMAMGGNPQPAMAGQGAPSFQGGSMVTLRAPDGSTQAVPAHLAQQFISRGAVPVQ
jgi:hypothetical protein